ncbi:MAG: hypothetical protein K6G11_03460 [Lachnospiraceae bacterium]|nr:hypothetical protein [Lachnospiraceae bacterium]
MQAEKFDIENKIEEIQAMLDECDTKKFDSSKLIVPSDAIYDLLAELKNCIPEEIDRYRKIIDQRSKIINGANNDAQRILEDANRQKDILVGENNIVREAKQEAQYIIEQANAEADRIVNNAHVQAESLRSSVTAQSHDIFEGTMYYTSDRLDEIERLLDDINLMISDGMRSFEAKINDNLSTIRQNRAELETTTFENVSGGAIYDDGGYQDDGQGGYDENFDENFDDNYDDNYDEQ